MGKAEAGIKPIVKWVGGKRQLLEAIRPLIPEFETYYEPFVGGGAVFFSLCPRHAVINDCNEELINLYRVIRDQPQELLALLREHRDRNCQEYFYEIRGLDRSYETYRDLTDAQRAARTIYLNKTCYNGLYRVNRSGKFNAPWGRHKTPNIVNEKKIVAMNRYLQEARVQILCGDYRQSFRGIERGAFVYLDPPYMPLSFSSSFTSYTASGFGPEQQRELRRQCDLLDRRGVRFLLSNSCCEFIEDLYRDYQIDRVPARRMVNVRADRRHDAFELLIRNYRV